MPLLLVALVGWRDLRKPLWLVAAAGTVGVLGLMFGVGPFLLVRELPGLRNIHFGNYFGLAIDFMLALLAAAGFDRLRKGITGLRSWMGVSLLLMALVVVMLVALSFGVAGHPAYLLWRAQYIQLVLITFAAATLVFAAAPDRTTWRRPWFAWGLVSLLLIEGMVNLHFPRQKRWDVWENPPAYVEYLQQNAGLERVFTIGSALYPNAGSAFKIMQLDSLMMFNAPRTYQALPQVREDGDAPVHEACGANSARARARCGEHCLHRDRD